MPVLKCNKCGGTTNTAISDYNRRNIKEGAFRCYARFENGKWVKGCAYSRSSSLMKHVADDLIKSVPKEI